MILHDSFLKHLKLSVVGSPIIRHSQPLINDINTPLLLRKSNLLLIFFYLKNCTYRYLVNIKVSTYLDTCAKWNIPVVNLTTFNFCFIYFGQYLPFYTLSLIVNELWENQN